MRSRQATKTPTTLLPGVVSDILYRSKGITLYLLMRPGGQISLIYLNRGESNRQLAFSVTKCGSQKARGLAAAKGYEIEIEGVVENGVAFKLSVARLGRRGQGRPKSVFKLPAKDGEERVQTDWQRGDIMLFRSLFNADVARVKSAFFVVRQQ